MSNYIVPNGKTQWAQLKQWKKGVNLGKTLARIHGTRIKKQETGDTGELCKSYCIHICWNRWYWCSCLIVQFQLSSCFGTCAGILPVLSRPLQPKPDEWHYYTIKWLYRRAAKSQMSLFTLCLYSDESTRLAASPQQTCNLQCITHTHRKTSRLYSKLVHTCINLINSGRWWSLKWHADRYAEKCVGLTSDSPHSHPIIDMTEKQLCCHGNRANLRSWTRMFSYGLNDHSIAHWSVCVSVCVHSPKMKSAVVDWVTKLKFTCSCLCFTESWHCSCHW